jgi:hypothetical protein
MPERDLNGRRATGATGLAAALLFAAGSALWAFDQPQAGAPPAEVLAFYESASGRIVAGGSLSLLSIALFVFFAAGVRELLRERGGGDALPTAAYGGVLLAMAAGLGAETINMAGALRAGQGELTPDLAQALFEVSYVLGYNAAGVGLGIFLLAIGAAALRARALLPAWLAVVFLIAGVAFLTPLSQVLLGPAVLLLAGASLQLLRAPGD